MTTKKSRALQTLLAGEPLSTPKAIRADGNWRLAADIHRLRRDGWVIQTVKGPKGAAVYYLKRPPKGCMTQLDLFAL